MDNFMTLRVSAISENEKFARSVVAAFCTPLDPTVDQIEEIKTAVSEAVTNSIVHGYRKQGGIIEINARLSGNTLHIDVVDEGVGIDDIEKAREPLFTTLPEDERMGMGFVIMESFMDTLEVLPNGEKGVVVRMSKCLDNVGGGEFVRTKCCN